MYCQDIRGLNTLLSFLFYFISIFSDYILPLQKINFLSKTMLLYLYTKHPQMPISSI